MGRTKSDISNSAIRIFLQDVGKFYDKARGYDPFGPKKYQKEELLNNLIVSVVFVYVRLIIKPYHKTI